MISGLLVIYPVPLAISLPGRWVHRDEAWLGEQDCFLLQDGVLDRNCSPVTCESKGGFWFTHKLVIAPGVVAAGLLGWELSVSRPVSLVLGTVSRAG